MKNIILIGGGGNAWESDFEDDFSLDEYFDDRKESSMQVAVSIIV